MKGKGWFKHSREHSLASRGVKTAVKDNPCSKVQLMNSINTIKPYDYQDSNQEETIHDSGWHKGDNYRFVLEGTGDIFRELTKETPHYSYIYEKIERIEHHIEDEKSWIHPEDSYDYSRENNKSKFILMKKQWESQPTINNIQKQAVKLNIAMLDKDFDVAKKQIKTIKEHFE